MDTTFKKGKTSVSHTLLLNLRGKINLNRSDKYVALSNFRIYYTWNNVKKSHKNNKSTFTWDSKWTQTGLRFHFGVKFNFGVSNSINVHMTSVEVKPTWVQIPLRSIWPKWNFKLHWVQTTFFFNDLFLIEAAHTSDYMWFLA